MSAKFWHPASKRNIVTVWKRKQQMKVSSCNFISIVLMIIFRLKSANTMSVQKKPDVKTKRIWYNLHLGIKNPNLVSLSYMICQIILCQEVIYKISLHTIRVESSPKKTQETLKFPCILQCFQICFRYKCTGKSRWLTWHDSEKFRNQIWMAEKCTTWFSFQWNGRS